MVCVIRIVFSSIRIDFLGNHWECRRDFAQGIPIRFAASRNGIVHWMDQCVYTMACMVWYGTGYSTYCTTPFRQCLMVRIPSCLRAVYNIVAVM